MLHTSFISNANSSTGCPWSIHVHFEPLDTKRLKVSNTSGLAFNWPSSVPLTSSVRVFAVEINYSLLLVLRGSRLLVHTPFSFNLSDKDN